MRHITWKALAAAVLLLCATGSSIRAQQQAPDLILTNRKIITVDDRFTIAQAVAVRGERIVAAGANAEVAKLAGPGTRRIDLRGRAKKIPGNA